MNNRNVQHEINRIILFIQKVIQDTKRKTVVIGWSGGLDSTTCLYLLAKALPPNNIHVLHLPYEKTYIKELNNISRILSIPNRNIHEIQIHKTVQTLWSTLLKGSDTTIERIRVGNIMARMRMIILFDYAQRIKGLVCGTENRSEHLLGYYTRYGDQASDFEPITHLYKTEVREVAANLCVPQNSIDRKPSADLWKGQTDEGEFGFTYDEADQVLKHYTDHKQNVLHILKKYPHADAVIKRMSKHNFKHHVPYHL